MMRSAIDRCIKLKLSISHAKIVALGRLDLRRNKERARRRSARVQTKVARHHVILIGHDVDSAALVVRLDGDDCTDKHTHA